MKIKDLPVQVSEDEEKFAKKYLAGRSAHTRGTIEMTNKLSANYQQLEEVKTVLQKAALFHDCARGLPLEQQRKLALKFRGQLDEIEIQNSSLWHAPAGGQLLVENLDYCSDNIVVQAVGYHSTGKSGGTLVLQGLIIADFTEKNRNFPAAHRLRKQIPGHSFKSILRKVYAEKITSCLKKEVKIHPRSIGAYNSLCV